MPTLPTTTTTTTTEPMFGTQCSAETTGKTNDRRFTATWRYRCYNATSDPSGRCYHHR